MSYIDVAGSKCANGMDRARDDRASPSVKVLTMDTSEHWRREATQFSDDRNRILSPTEWRVVKRNKEEIPGFGSLQLGQGRLLGAKKVEEPGEHGTDHLVKNAQEPAADKGMNERINNANSRPS